MLSTFLFRTVETGNPDARIVVDSRWHVCKRLPDTAIQRGQFLFGAAKRRNLHRLRCRQRLGQRPVRSVRELHAERRARFEVDFSAAGASPTTVALTVTDTTTSTVLINTSTTDSTSRTAVDRPFVRLRPVFGRQSDAALQPRPRVQPAFRQPADCRCSHVHQCDDDGHHDDLRNRSRPARPCSGIETRRRASRPAAGTSSAGHFAHAGRQHGRRWRRLFYQIIGTNGYGSTTGNQAYGALPAAALAFSALGDSTYLAYNDVNDSSYQRGR